MEQLAFFAESGQSDGLPRHLLEYIPGVFTSTESAALLLSLIRDSSWKQPVMKIYDKELITPRLTAWFGDVRDPVLTGRIAEISPWTGDLLFIREKVKALSGMDFNSVLLNYYRDGNDSVAWHSDKESTPGKPTVVASVSFGQVRSFDIRRKDNHQERYSVKLEDGSFLLMKAGLQDHWEHRIAKSARPMKPRLNLTFRQVGRVAGNSCPL